MSNEDRNVYIFTYAGWKHLGTGKVVERERGGLPLDTEDVQALKELYIQDEDEKGDTSSQLPVDSKKGS